MRKRNIHQESNEDPPTLYISTLHYDLSSAVVGEKGMLFPCPNVPSCSNIFRDGAWGWVRWRLKTEIKVGIEIPPLVGLFPFQPYQDRGAMLCILSQHLSSVRNTPIRSTRASTYLGMYHEYIYSVIILAHPHLMQVHRKVVWLHRLIEKYVRV